MIVCTTDFRKETRKKTSIALAVLFKGKVNMGSGAANWSAGWSSRLCLAWQHHSGGKKGVSKGKAERRGRGKKEKPTSETRAVPGTNHIQGNGCREAPDPVAMEWGRRLGLGLSPFPEAVDLRDALDLMTFLPWNSCSLSGGAVGTPGNMLQGRAGHAELSREMYLRHSGGKVG